ADRAELRQLPGIGDTLASRIADYRRDHGDFRQVDDLRKVRGIGPVVLERLKPFIIVEPLERDSEDAPAAPLLPPQPPRSDLLPVTLRPKPVVLGRIDLNRATSEELRKLPGIGTKLSERIVETRKRRTFTSVDELRRVPGIGPKTLQRLRPLLTVDGE